MPDRYTLREAIRLLEVDNKTFKGWLAESHIVPLEDKSDKRKKLLTLEQLQTLATNYHRQLPLPSAAADPLTALESRLTAHIRRLEQRLAALEVRLADQPSLTFSARPEAARAVQPVQRPTAPRQPPESPPGASETRLSHVGAQVFLKSHGVKERVSKGWHTMPLSSRRAVLLYAQQQGPVQRCGDAGCICRQVL